MPVAAGLMPAPVAAPGPGYPAPGAFSGHCEVPPDKVGLLIGRQGENIKRLMATTGCQIVLGKETLPNGLRPVTISGHSQDAVDNTRRMVMDCVSGIRPPRDGGGNPGAPSTGGFVPPPGVPSLLVIVPNAIIGLLIGKGGVTIKDIQAQSQCRVVIDKEANGEDRNITLVGPLQGIEYCKNAIQDIINKQAEFQARGAAGGGGGPGGPPRGPPGFVPRGPVPHMGGAPQGYGYGQPGQAGPQGYGQGMQGIPGQGIPGQGIPGQGIPGQGMSGYYPPPPHGYQAPYGQPPQQQQQWGPPPPQQDYYQAQQQQQWPGYPPQPPRQ